MIWECNNDMGSSDDNENGGNDKKRRDNDVSSVYALCLMFTLVMSMSFYME